MTREEAIERLKWVDPHDLEEKDLEAIRIAIEALQSTMSQERVNHESTNDLISRADAIEAVKHSMAYMHDDLYEAISIRIPSAVCDDCIWTVCNYNKVDWDTPYKGGDDE